MYSQIHGLLILCSTVTIVNFDGFTLKNYLTRIKIMKFPSTILFDLQLGLQAAVL